MQNPPCFFAGGKLDTLEIECEKKNLPRCCAGPEASLKLDSREIKCMMYWVPPLQRVAITVSFLTYADQVRMAVICDRSVLPNPEILTRDFIYKVNACFMSSGFRYKNVRRKILSGRAVLSPRAHTHTHTCTRTRARAHTHTHTHTHARAHTHTHTHTHKYTHARARERIHGHPHALVHHTLHYEEEFTTKQKKQHWRGIHCGSVAF